MELFTICPATLSIATDFSVLDFNDLGSCSQNFYLGPSSSWAKEKHRNGQTTPSLIAGLIKGNQRFIRPDHKAGYFWGGILGGVGWLAINKEPSDMNHEILVGFIKRNSPECFMKEFPCNLISLGKFSSPITQPAKDLFILWWLMSWISSFPSGFKIKGSLQGVDAPQVTKEKTACLPLRRDFMEKNLSKGSWRDNLCWEITHEPRKKHPRMPYFRLNPGCFIGILMMVTVYYNPYIFIAHMTFLEISLKEAFDEPAKAVFEKASFSALDFT